MIDYWWIYKLSCKFKFCSLILFILSDFGYTLITDRVIAGFRFAHSFTTMTRLRYSTRTAVFNPNVKKKSKKKYSCTNWKERHNSAGGAWQSAGGGGGGRRDKRATEQEKKSLRRQAAGVKKQEGEWGREWEKINGELATNTEWCPSGPLRADVCVWWHVSLTSALFAAQLGCHGD